MQLNNRDVSLINGYNDVIQQSSYDSHAKFCNQSLEFLKIKYKRSFGTKHKKNLAIFTK